MILKPTLVYLFDKGYVFLGIHAVDLALVQKIDFVKIGLQDVFGHSSDACANFKGSQMVLLLVQESVEHFETVVAINGVILLLAAHHTFERTRLPVPIFFLLEIPVPISIDFPELLEIFVSISIGVLDLERLVLLV